MAADCFLCYYSILLPLICALSITPETQPTIINNIQCDNISHAEALYNILVTCSLKNGTSTSTKNEDYLKSYNLTLNLAEINQEDASYLFFQKKEVRVGITLEKSNFTWLNITHINKWTFTNETQIVIRNNPHLQHLELSFNETEAENNQTVLGIIIENNSQLKTIKTMQNRALWIQRIRNNPQLNRDALEELKEWSRKSGVQPEYFQEAKECYGNMRISDLREIKHCEIIIGDLDIVDVGNYFSSERWNLAKIVGCVRINGTNITSIVFLEDTIIEQCNGTSEIINNQELCDLDLENYSDQINFDNNCSPATISVCEDVKQLTEKCYKAVGDIEVGLLTSPKWLKQLEQIEELDGTVTVEKTMLERLDFLKRLRRINSKGNDKPALAIRDNWMLKSLNLSHLNELPWDSSQVAVDIRRNYKLKLEKKNVDHFAKTVGLELGITLIVEQNEYNYSRHEESTRRIMVEAEEQEKKKVNGELANGVSLGIYIVLVLITGILTGLLACRNQYIQGIKNSRKKSASMKNKPKKSLKSGTFSGSGSVSRVTLKNKKSLAEAKISTAETKSRALTIKTRRQKRI